MINIEIKDNVIVKLDLFSISILYKLNDTKTFMA